jgi:urease accessory protein
MNIRLLHLASPALPVGAFSYSQGLEWAVESGQVHNAATAQHWLHDTLTLSAARLDAPAVAAFWRARHAGDAARAATLNDVYLAMRDSAEARAEAVQMGRSLWRLLTDLGLPASALPPADTENAYPNVWAAAAVHWQIDLADAVNAYLWSWLENQVMAAIKLIPLGQTDGQRILLALADHIPPLADAACQMPDDAWQNLSPALNLAAAKHETQYSRLFRS